MKSREKFVPLAAALFVCAGLQVRAFIHNLKSLLSGESLSDIPFMPDIVLPTSVYVKLMILCALEFAVLVLFAVFFLNMRRRTLYRAALIAGAVVNTFMFFAAPIYSYPVLALLCVFLFIDSLLSHKLLTASRIACIAALAFTFLTVLSDLLSGIIGGYPVTSASVTNLLTDTSALPLTVLPFSLMMYCFALGKTERNTVTEP